MAEASAKGTVLEFRIHLLGITPMIWRGLQLRAEHTLTDLHNAIQIAFDWTDYSLHQFERRGRAYCAPHAYGLDGADASSVKLGDLRLRAGERFLYTYDYIAFWRHQVRFERQSLAKARTTYPYCSGGARRSPKEDFGGPDHFMQLQVKNGPIDLIREGMGLLESLQEGEEAFTEYLDEHWEEFPLMQY